MRSTPPSLKQHESRSFRQPLARDTSSALSSDQVTSWKSEQERHKWLRQREQERAERLLLVSKTSSGRTGSSPLERTSSPQESKEHQALTPLRHRSAPNMELLEPSVTLSRKVSQSDSAMLLTPPKAKRLTRRIKRQNSLNDLSMVPMDELGSVVAPPELTRTSPSKQWSLFCCFRKTNGVSTTAQQILDKERLEAKAMEEQRVMAEKKEKRRIERKRRQWIEAQRAKEAAASIIPTKGESSTGRYCPSIPEETPVSSGSTSGGDTTVFPFDSLSRACASTCFISDVSTGGASSTTMSLPPCVVCGMGLRTYIAMPCMHFSFCKKCATGLQSLSPTSCPVCHEKNVTFASVSV